MTTNAQPKPVTEDVIERIYNQVDALLGKWDRRGYCPCCVARALLAHAGLFAAHTLHPDDMREVLGYLATLSEKHAPPSDDTVRH